MNTSTSVAHCHARYILPLLFILGFFLVGSAEVGTTGTGGKKLDIFSGQKPPASPTDTLTFQLATSKSLETTLSSIPDRFRLYDLDLDGAITVWETNEVVIDFKGNDSPYSETEVYSFIDYFFTVSEPVSEPFTY